MNLVDLLKKNIVMVPVVASVLVGTFTGVKYVVNLTDTINANKAEIQELKTMSIENINRDMSVLTDNVNTIIAKLEERIHGKTLKESKPFQTKCSSHAICKSHFVSPCAGLFPSNRCPMCWTAA